MKLSLSVRIAESAARKDVAAIPIEDLAPLARIAGFDGLSMRASALSVQSESERIDEVRGLLDRENLAVSMVTGNVALAANTPDAIDCLRKITPHLDLATALGARLVRIMMHNDDNIGDAQRAADEAAERGITLAHQTHWGTICETIDQALELVRRMDRSNFKITCEPSNLMACGGDYGPDAIARLAPHLANFYFQNVRLDPDGTHVFKTWRRGPVPVTYVALDDAGGIDVGPLIAALKQSGYDGWISVHQPLRAGQDVAHEIDHAARFFRSLLTGR